MQNAENQNVYVIHVNTFNCLSREQKDKCLVTNGDPITCRACPIEIYKNGILIYTNDFDVNKNYVSYTLNFIENIKDEKDLMKVLKTKLAHFILYNNNEKVLTDNLHNNISEPKYYVLTKTDKIEKIK